MINQSQISTISDLRFKTKEVFKKAKDTPVYLFQHSTPKGVLMSMEKYQEIENQLEDYYLAMKAEGYEQEDKSQIKWLTHDEVRKIIRGK